MKMGQPKPPTLSLSLPVDQTTYAGSAFIGNGIDLTLTG